MNGKETILHLEYDKNGVLMQKVLITKEDGTTEMKWQPVPGQTTKIESLSERFENDDFKPHAINTSKESNITRKLKISIDYNVEMTEDNVKKHVEKSIRMDNLLKKLLKSPDIIMKEGFDFKGNSELKKAIELICYEMGSPWVECIPKFK